MLTFEGVVTFERRYFQDSMVCQLIGIALVVFTNYLLLQEWYFGHCLKNCSIFNICQFELCCNFHNMYCFLELKDQLYYFFRKPSYKVPFQRVPNRGDVIWVWTVVFGCYFLCPVRGCRETNICSVAKLYWNGTSAFDVLACNPWKQLGSTSFSSSINASMVFCNWQSSLF